MEKISRISKTPKTENNLRHQENSKEKSKNASMNNFDSMLKQEQQKQEEQKQKERKSELEKYKFELPQFYIKPYKTIQKKEEKQENEHDEK